MDSNKYHSTGNFKRWKYYWSQTGPGWMQSAVTIGGATAMTSLFSGILMKYDLLWVGPIAMLCAIIMLTALSYQTLVTGERPFRSMVTYASPILGWAWVIATLLTTIIWHFPQYVLISGMTEDLLDLIFGYTFFDSKSVMLKLIIGVIYLSIAITAVWSYGNSRNNVSRFDLFIKYMVWFIIICFLILVLNRSYVGEIDWKEVFKGFWKFKIPTDSAGLNTLVGAFSAAFGINMAFLYGYSFLKKGWGKEDFGLVQFDLFTGMFLPFVFATSLMIIGSGATLYDPSRSTIDSISITPLEIGVLLEQAGVPIVISRIIFGVGIIGMGLNAIIIHMLICGFAGCEIFGFEMHGTKYKLACLIPTPAVLGVFFWDKLGLWVAVPASAIAGIMLPIAYIGIFLLNNNSRFLGKYKPKGTKAILWNIGMIFSILVSSGVAIYFIINNIIGL